MRLEPELYRMKSGLAIELLMLLVSVTPLFHGWKVTLIFYATLHQVQYAALRGDKIPETHKERKWYVRRNLNEVSGAYEVLKAMSVTARYDPYTEFTGLSVKYAKELRQYILSATT